MIEKRMICDVLALKNCHNCNLEKSLAEFTIHKDTKDGFSNNCRVCQKRRRRQSYERNRAILGTKQPTGDKQCRQCGELKSTEDFHRNFANLEGLHNLCKTCRRVADQRRFARNERRLEVNPPRGGKVCAKCQKEKELSKFYVDRTKKDCRKTYCKQCSNEQKKTWLQNNSGKLKQRRDRFALKKKQQEKNSIAELLLAYADSKLK